MPFIWASLLLFLVHSFEADGKDSFDLKYQFQRRGKPYIHAFVLSWGAPQANLQSIDVMVPESNALIQKIVMPQDRVKIVWSDIQTSQPQATRELIFDQLDYNFDRFADFRILREFPMKVGKKNYLVYLFDKDKNQYILNEEISALPAPIPNPKTKRIESTTLGGFGGFESVSQHYSVSPFGKLVLETQITSKVVDALRLSIEKEVSVIRQKKMTQVCKVVEEPEGITRHISGTQGDCRKYLTPPKPKKWGM